MLLRVPNKKGDCININLLWDQLALITTKAILLPSEVDVRQNTMFSIGYM